jgi:glutamine amidotransferase
VITIINYGLGNVQAIANIYKRLNIPVTLAQDAAGLQDARKVLLPGVGAFDWAMTRLNDSGMREPLDALVRAGECDVLGICVGMQILAERSDEGQLPGLGWIRGEVKRFDDKRFTGRTHLPHMGWNDVTPRADEALFQGLGDEARFYFLHSYYFAPASEDDALATADYGGPFVCAVRHRKVAGVQFHPEKSHQWGIQLLNNFAVC